MAHFSPLGMDGTLAVYRPQADLSASPQPDGWLRLCRPGDPVGVALDPLLAAVWSAADGHTVAQVAQATRISTYLAACALAVLQRAGLLLNGEPGTARPVSSPSSLLPGSHPLSLSCFVVHHHAEADLDSCLTSLAALDGITVLTTLPASAGDLSVRLIRFQAGALLPTLAGEVGRTAAASVLILDSRFQVEPGWLDGLAIHRSDGIHITGPNTQFAGLDIPAVEGEGIVTYTIPALPLLEGLYYLSVSAHNWEDTEMYDYQDRMYSFRVLSVGGEKYGVINSGGIWGWQGRVLSSG